MTERQRPHLAEVIANQSHTHLVVQEGWVMISNIPETRDFKVVVISYNTTEKMMSDDD